MTITESDTAHYSSNSDLEERVTSVGHDLGNTLQALVESLPDAPYGPQALAQELGVDKVLTSRLLKALRTKEPVAVVFHAPGPEPLRRLVRAARRRGASPDVVKKASGAIARFEQLIRQEAGDRSSLDAILSAWLPEARRDFELRRKQAAFKAVSQLKGVMTETIVGTVLLHPSDDDMHIDIVWIFGLLGLRRLRPGVATKLTTRRMTEGGGPRTPENLSGRAIERVEDARLDEFCVAPPAPIEVRTVGNMYQYMLGGHGFGPRSAVDLVMAEVNYREMSRYVPVEVGRKGNVFTEISTPAKALLFDVLVHDHVYPGTDPRLLIYDTAFDGVADVNDPARDVDRLPLFETIQNLGRGAACGRDAKVSNYVEILRHVFGKLRWDDRLFRGYRCAVDYPLYGSQVAMIFDPPPPPGS